MDGIARAKGAGATAGEDATGKRAGFRGSSQEGTAADDFARIARSLSTTNTEPSA